MSGTGWPQPPPTPATPTATMSACRARCTPSRATADQHQGRRVGAIFGIGGAAYAYAAATNLLGIEGGEFNTFTEAGPARSTWLASALSVVRPREGAVIDAGIRIGAQSAVRCLVHISVGSGAWCSLTKTAPIPVFRLDSDRHTVSSDQDDSARDRPVSVHHDRVYSARDLLKSSRKTRSRWATTRGSPPSTSQVSAQTQA